MKLCSFFNAISQKVVDPMKLTKLQDDFILTESASKPLCGFWRIDYQ
jgi:hypothetical protein